MAKCFMCGAAIARGILCEKCDKPRAKAKPTEAAPKPADPRATQPSPAIGGAPLSGGAVVPAARAGEAPAPPPSTPPPPVSPRSSGPAAAAAVAPDPFPKAPVVPFPVESASLAVTSIVNLLVASGVASVLVGPDRSVKFVSDEAKKLFDAAASDIHQKFIETQTGIRIADLSTPTSAGIRIRNRSILYSLVPLSGGASGAVLVFRHADGIAGAHASFATYVREAVFGPLRALRDSLLAASRTRGNDPFLHDSAATVEQVLSSLELAPEVEETGPSRRPRPSVTDIVHGVAERFRPFADLKAVQMQVDAQELEEVFRDSDQLADALGILMDNALHYVPSGGQVVLGVRWMEHKGKPLLLFFVMDNGPVVPETLRTAIFEPDFVWNPTSPERTGRSLFRTREFAVAHAGSVWVESKTGKACTFFLRVRPDGVR